jgi:hypothetical protein
MKPVGAIAVGVETAPLAGCFAFSSQKAAALHPF